jgi:hypothetical protein
MRIKQELTEKGGQKEEFFFPAPLLLSARYRVSDYRLQART